MITGQTEISGGDPKEDQRKKKIELKKEKTNSLEELKEIEGRETSDICWTKRCERKFLWRERGLGGPAKKTKSKSIPKVR